MSYCSRVKTPSTPKEYQVKSVGKIYPIGTLGSVEVQRRIASPRSPSLLPTPIPTTYRRSDEFVTLRPLSARTPPLALGPLPSMSSSRRSLATSPRYSAVSPRSVMESQRTLALSPRSLATAPRYSAVSPRSLAVSPRYPTVSPRYSAVSPRSLAVSPRPSPLYASTRGLPSTVYNRDMIPPIGISKSLASRMGYQ